MVAFQLDVDMFDMFPFPLVLPAGTLVALLQAEGGLRYVQPGSAQGVSSFFGLKLRTQVSVGAFRKQKVV